MEGSRVCLWHLMEEFWSGELWRGDIGVLLPFWRVFELEESAPIQCDFRTSWASAEATFCAHVGGGNSAIEDDPCWER